MEQEDLPNFMFGLREWFRELGFDMAVEEPVFEFEGIEFCQTHPVFDGSEYIMCRNPHTAIPKDATMLHCWQTSSLFRGWLDAVGTGGLALTGGLPVFQDLYSSYVRSGEKRKVPVELLPWSFRQWKEGVNRAYGDVHPLARSSFYSAFGITPDEQVCMEKYYQSLMIVAFPVPYAARTILA